MKLGILGGTFNPVHNSHLYLADAFFRGLALDELLLIPTRRPPHKEAPDLAPAAHRLAMCRLAAAGRPGYGVSGYEVNRAGPSYTVDTLRHLRAAYPGAHLHLLMGGDMFLTVQEWRSARELMALATLCAAAREPGEMRRLQAHKTALEAMGARCVLLDVAAQPLSSTQVRRRIRAGADAAALLPPPVLAYIRANGLYGAGAGGATQPTTKGEE